MSEIKSQSPATYDQFVRKLFNRSGDPSKDFTHAILGIVTEIHEYLSAPDEVNAREELGGLAFYEVALGQVITDLIGPFTPMPLGDGLQYLHDQAIRAGCSGIIANTCNTLLDDAKRWVGYNKQPKSLIEVYSAARELIYFVNQTGPYPDSDSQRIQRTNMAKLLKRYPGGEYSQYHALVRDLGAERAVLESN